MEVTITGKTAFVTGAASGIGRSTAILLAESGAQVGVSDIDAEGVQRTVDTIHQSGGEALALPGDIADVHSVEAMVKSIVARFGKLDIAINNAGIATQRLAPLGDITDGEWDRMIAVNLSGVRNCLRWELAEMRRNGGGAIVNVSSGAGLRAVPNCGAYVAAKHGVIGLTRNAAAEYVRDGIRVNVICPGFIDTPMQHQRETPGQPKRDLSSMCTMGRAGLPEEIASAALWLVSDKASFVTGATLPVDGGWQA